MFTKETVFILGAGASVPYGYPTAQGLRDFIIKDFRQKYIFYLHKKYNHSSDEAEKIANKFMYLIQSFNQSGTKSFDLFLSRNRGEYYEQGKFILAWCILYFESSSKFNEEIKNPASDWYKWLYNEMTDELVKSSDLEKINENKLKIITFNYDRSLEEYLEESLIFSFSGDRKDVTKFTEWINVIHTYGKILDLRWENLENGEKYSTNNILDLADKAKENIQIIYDERISRNEEIQKIITSAERIFILGFGYSKENLEAIGLQNCINRNQYIYGTTKDFEENEIKKTKNLIRKLKPEIRDDHIILENTDCVGLLRRYY